MYIYFIQYIRRIEIYLCVFRKQQAIANSLFVFFNCLELFANLTHPLPFDK